MQQVRFVNEQRDRLEAELSKLQQATVLKWIGVEGCDLWADDARDWAREHNQQTANGKQTSQRAKVVVDRNPQRGRYWFARRNQGSKGVNWASWSWTAVAVRHPRLTTPAPPKLNRRPQTAASPKRPATVARGVPSLSWGPDPAGLAVRAATGRVGNSSAEGNGWSYGVGDHGDTQAGGVAGGEGRVDCVVDGWTGGRSRGDCLKYI